MYADRLARLQQTLQKRQIECLTLMPGPNLLYLTGFDFHLMERPTLALIPAEGRPAFVIPRLEQARLDESPPFDLQPFPYSDGDDPSRALAHALQSIAEVHLLAVEYLRMRVLELSLLRASLPVVYMTDAGPVLETLRLYKSPEEIALHQQAVSISEHALTQVLGELAPGMTERQIATRLTLSQLELGGGPPPFEAIVLIGEHTAYPHGTPGERTLKAGDALLVDFGTSYQRYISDITRCFFIGEAPSPHHRTVYEAVLAANEDGHTAAQAGATGEQVDRAARQSIEAAGFGSYFIHRTGHGIGLEAHEGPYLVAGNSTPLAQGMVFTVEPGIYIPGELGVRIEDNVAITADGPISLTTFPRALQIIAL